MNKKETEETHQEKERNVGYDMTNTMPFNNGKKRGPSPPCYFLLHYRSSQNI